MLFPTLLSGGRRGQCWWSADLLLVNSEEGGGGGVGVQTEVESLNLGLRPALRNKGDEGRNL